MSKMNQYSAGKVFWLAEKCEIAGYVLGGVLILSSIISCFVVPGMFKLLVIIPGVIAGILAFVLFYILAAFLEAMGHLAASNVQICNALTGQMNENAEKDQKNNRTSASNPINRPGSSLYKPKGL